MRWAWWGCSVWPVLTDDRTIRVGDNWRARSPVPHRCRVRLVAARNMLVPEVLLGTLTRQDTTAQTEPFTWLEFGQPFGIAPGTDTRTKQRIGHILIREVLIDLTGALVTIHCNGGRHTELHVSRVRTGRYLAHRPPIRWR
jgi:hypothetical protein